MARADRCLSSSVEQYINRKERWKLGNKIGKLLSIVIWTLLANGNLFPRSEYEFRRMGVLTPGRTLSSFLELNGTSRKTSLFISSYKIIICPFKGKGTSTWLTSNICETVHIPPFQRLNHYCYIFRRRIGQSEVVRSQYDTISVLIIDLVQKEYIKLPLSWRWQI